MMRRTLSILASAMLLAACATPAGRTVTSVPEIFPDYAGVTVPPGIAPLDFCMADSLVTGIDVTVAGSEGALHSRGRSCTRFHVRRWHRLLASNAGQDLHVTVRARKDGDWTDFAPFSIHVSADPSDFGLVYRKIAPGYSAFSKLGIYERDLSSFRERALIENTSFIGCVNCHTSNRCDPETFSLHIRGAHGATLLRTDGVLDAYDTKTDSTSGFCVYPYWHPSGAYVAYSNNATRQGFHEGPDKLIEVFDHSSDLCVYDVRAGKLLFSRNLKGDSRWETFPAFSADGRTLYFCAAEPKAIPDSLNAIRYSLYKTGFDPEKGTFGTSEQLVIDAASEGKSISFPRPSYDGRFLMFTKSDYGNFSIWHHESDLWLLDLETGESVPMEGVNSDDTESFHNWDSSSRWFVFSSRRDDGLHTRLYLCHIDENGVCGKPFMLPQRDPRAYYGSMFQSYNVPEFVSGRVPFQTKKAARLINSDARTPFKI